MQRYSWGNNMIKDSEHEELSETVDSSKMHNITSSWEAGNGVSSRKKASSTRA